ncbi:MAG: shikimate dehydrogenase [Bacteroidales bacterium]|nr:shikimate dehydrogenase [Bacteroidales bacterium]
MKPFELGLIGQPLTHSRSAEYFNSRFNRLSIPGRYINMPLRDISELPEALAEHPLLIGFNVTAPYKQAVIPYLARLSPEAVAVGAVNTVKIVRTDFGTELCGFNTDVAGFRESLRPMLNPSRPHRALILGSGGASRAVSHALSELGVESLIVSRKSAPGRITYGELDEGIYRDYDIIINATPLGTFPATDAAPAIDYSRLTPAHICYDLVYNPPLTRFLQEALKQGALVRNGLQMLRLQADAAYAIWV